MASYSYTLYRPADISFSGGITLTAGYDPANRIFLTIEDDDTVFEGDLFVNEDGNDSNQFGTATLPNGTVLGGPTTTVYAEEHYTLTHPVTGAVTRLYRVELDSNPASTAGAGILLGYMPSSPLEPGVTYSFSASNTVPSNDQSYDDIEGALCFTDETLIETENGLQRAGDLTPGTRLKTLNGHFRKLRWVYHRHVSREELLQAPELMPILFEPGALGENRPNRPTRLSAQHKVLIRSPRCELMYGHSEMLTPAKALVNQQTIRRDTSCRDVTYIHLLLDRHEILYAHNLEAESLDPAADALTALTPEARRELEQLVPDYVNARRDAGMLRRPALTLRETRALIA